MGGCGLPARSPQRLFSYVVLSLLPPSQGTKQEQPGSSSSSTVPRHPRPEMLLPPVGVPGTSAHAPPQAASHAQLPGSWGLHRGCFYFGPTNQRETMQRCWRAMMLSGDCRRSLGLEGREGDIDYGPFHLYRALSRCSGLRTRSKPIWARTKGASRSNKALLHTPGLLLGRPMPRAPYAPD